ncbi:MAG TPA: secondary thiamine-phosphate synthase [Eubacteriaceae bacterium]|nr:secondary thiamine-phosphate synthase [Eubacteriaceae bacterium]
MTVYKKSIDVESRGRIPTYVNITEKVKKAIAESGIVNGTCTVISPHTTCAVFFEEFVHDIDENGNESLQVDLNRVLEKMIPNHDHADTYIYPGEEHYKEVESWPNAEEYLPGGDRKALWNGDAHIKATMIGSSEVFDVDQGELGVGTTGNVYFVDFDRTRARKRTCKIIVMGE